MKKQIIIFMQVLAILGAGVLIGFLLCDKSKKAEERNNIGEENLQGEKAYENGYQYINKKLVPGLNYPVSKASFVPFVDEINALIDSEKKLGRISDISIFFRDLNSGPTFSLNELEKFSAASLLKVPLAVAYFHLEEERPGILKTRLHYIRGGKSFAQNFQPSKKLNENETYTVEELLLNMLVYSDNISQSILAQHIEKIPEGMDALYQVYEEIGARETDDVLREYITVSGYTSIFRQLYNVSYLNEEFSEKMLSWLAQSDFKGGLVAGVPATVKVAHKFGERIFSNEENVKQLHDCGIIYFPDNPYLLCVMTRGSEWESLSDFIKVVSEKVYQEMESRRIK